VVIRPRARDDITRQFRWYLQEQDVPDTAFRFLDAIQATIDRISEMPDIGAPRLFKNPLLAGMPSWPVDGFERIRIYISPMERSCGSFASCTAPGIWAPSWKTKTTQSTNLVI
jgi:plasmid stabilization system protein ParE